MDKFSWIIEIGNDFTKLLQFTDEDDNPLDLTGYSFKLQIRKCRTDSAVIATLESPADIDISDVANGNITINIDKTVTVNYPEVNAVFDLRWTTDLDITQTVKDGNVQISLPITR